MSKPEELPDALQRLRELLEAERGHYIGIETLSGQTGIAPDVILEVAAHHPEVVRTSLLQTSDSAPVFTLNTPLSGLVDAFNAIRQISDKKY